MENKEVKTGEGFQRQKLLAFRGSWKNYEGPTQ
jgi:hypothetical protein